MEQSIEARVKKLIDMKKVIDEMKADYETIKAELAEHLTDTVTLDGYAVSKYIKSTPKLKDKDDEAGLAIMYPDLSKTKFDLNAFVKKHGDIAKDYIEFKDTAVVTVREVK